MTILTRNQQVAQRALILLNQSLAQTELSLQLTQWFQQLGITPLPTEGTLEGLGDRYSLTQEQLRAVAEAEIGSTPDWFTEPDQSLQYAAPGFYIAFLLSTGRHTIMTVTDVRTIDRGATTLLGLDGIAQGWYNMEGLRTTKEGHLFQGSAYAGRIFPVTLEIHQLIEREELLTEITGYHRAYFSGEGALHLASNETLREIKTLLQSRAPAASAAADTL